MSQKMLNAITLSKVSPAGHLTQILQDFPNIYDLVEQSRTTSKASSIFTWPSWCFISYQGWERICKALSTHDIEGISAVITWSFTQGIYRFDHNLMSRIPPMNSSLPIPTEVFFRLPEWGIYVESPSNSDFYGFYAYLLYKNNKAILNVLICGKSKELFTVELNQSLVSDIIINTQNINFEVSLRQLLYICSDMPNISKINNMQPARARPTKTKYGWKLFPAKRINIWLIGEGTHKGDVGFWHVDNSKSEKVSYTCNL